MIDRQANWVSIYSIIDPRNVVRVVTTGPVPQQARG